MRKLFNTVVFSILLCCMTVSQAATVNNTVTAARVWPAQDYTRITLETTGPMLYKMSQIKDPDRIVIDIENLEISTQLKSLADKIAATDPYVKQVRVARFKPDVVRIVVDLKTEVKPNLFKLAPAGEYKYRLVLDIYPLKDPLMAMLAQRDNALISTPEVGPVSPGSVAGLPPTSQAVGSTEVKTDATNAKNNVTAEAPKITTDAVESPKPAAPLQEAAKEQASIESTTEEEGVAYTLSGQRKITIAVDAGHGGEDPGARGASGSHEKDITLAIAKKLKAKINAETGMRAVLTRDDDYFIPLHGRVVKARKLQADLFVSIHADAFTNPAARGSSVFALSEKGATSASARYLAKKENESDLIGGVSLNVKDPVLARTLLDLSQTATINDSLKLGKAVLGHIGGINTLHKNHVEQAAFAVLKSPDIPSILVETAFISNPEEERKLLDDAYQDKLALSILSGIKKYFASNPALAKGVLAQD